MAGQLPPSVSRPLFSEPPSLRKELTLRQVLAWTEHIRLVARANELAAQWKGRAEHESSVEQVAAKMEKLAGGLARYCDVDDFETAASIGLEIERLHQNATERYRHAKLSAAGNRAKKKRAVKTAARYVAKAREVKKRRPALSLNAIAKLLEEAPPPFMPRYSARQILRYLVAAGLR